MWICHSGRPLHVDELCYALSITIGSIVYISIATLFLRQRCCSPAVRDWSLLIRKKVSTFRLIHHTFSASIAQLTATFSPILTRWWRRCAWPIISEFRPGQSSSSQAIIWPLKYALPQVLFVILGHSCQEGNFWIARYCLQWSFWPRMKKNHVPANSLFEQILNHMSSGKPRLPRGGMSTTYDKTYTTTNWSNIQEPPVYTTPRYLLASRPCL